MPFISPADRYLTVLNVFTTDAFEKQDTLLGAMRETVDKADYPGWISSTVHSGQEHAGSANLIQWRSKADLEARYAGTEFKDRTMPRFTEITTSIRLLQNEVVYTRQQSALDGATEISPDRDDYTVIDIYGVPADRQDALVEALGRGHAWLDDAPGYRSHTVLRGLDARGVEGAFVVGYGQWDGKESFDAHRTLPPKRWPAARREAQQAIDALATSHDWNGYQVVHTRSAGR